MFFLSTLHTICADMLIIHCTLFLKAIFLSSIRFFDTLVIFNKASKTLYIEPFPLVGLLLGFAARGGVLVLGHVTDHRTPIYAAPVAPSFLESTPLQPTGYDPYCASPSSFALLHLLYSCSRPCIRLNFLF